MTEFCSSLPRTTNRSSHFGVWPLEGARRPTRSSHHATLSLHKRRVCWQLLLQLSWWSVVPVWLITSLCLKCCIICACCQKHQVQGRLLWSFNNILTGSYSQVSTKHWTCSTHYCCCQAAWDGAVWRLGAILY